MTQAEFQQRYKYDTTTDRLGEGGFGEVFKAYDTFLDRWVAIKVSKVKAEMPELRLRNEVELVNKLPAHPNIARYEECYTFTSIAGEYDIAILQYYELGNLLQLIKSQSLSLGQKYSLLSSLLEGIRFIHDQNIIHRDIKPQNILIVKREDTYIPKITDFGISKKLKVLKNTQFSNSLIGAGTIAYSSPEQLADKTIRKNTDLWSFGVIAYQLLTGELPFNSGPHSTSSELGRQEILKQISSGKIPEKIELVPLPWKHVIEKCLVNDPEKRIKEAADCISLVTGQQVKDFRSSRPSNSIDIENDVTEIAATSNTKKRSYTHWLKKRNKQQLTILLTVTILMCITVIYFSLPKRSTKTVIETTTDPIKTMEPVIRDTLVQQQTGSKPAETNDEIKPEPVKPSEQAPPELEKTPQPAEKQLVFPNGDTYFGSVKNGKMHGKGKYVFNTDGIISKNDPMERKAEAGNYIEGEWFDGELYKGRLFDKNGILKERIIIGRN